MIKLIKNWKIPLYLYLNTSEGSVSHIAACHDCHLAFFPFAAVAVAVAVKVADTAAAAETAAASVTAAAATPSTF